MKDQIIEIMKIAGYDFIKEHPDTMMLFWDKEAEQEVQIWNNESQSLVGVIQLIKQREYNKGVHDGRADVRLSIKKALGL